MTKVKVDQLMIKVDNNNKFQIVRFEKIFERQCQNKNRFTIIVWWLGGGHPSA